MSHSFQKATSLTLCLISSFAFAGTNDHQNETVQSHLQQITQRQGKYAGHVWWILEATNGVPELIAQTTSTNAAIAATASSLLWQISSPIWQQTDHHKIGSQESSLDTLDWTEWWHDSGSQMSFQQLWRNFDSRHK
jgi:hypothetical protein